MNEFLQQFLIESRELAEQGTTGLLALERAPQDAAQLDAVFRALHTLKGGAAIVDFFAMERAVHAAEDVLSAARKGAEVLSPAMVGAVLSCLDQVLQWLDTIERSGELPSAACEGEADQIVARFGAFTGAGEAAAIQQSLAAHESAAGNWTAGLLARHPDVRAAAVTAVRYNPDPDCFFRGEDPVAQLSALPELLAFEVRGAAPWPPLETLNPFRCNLVLFALARCTAGQAAVHLQRQNSECEIVALSLARPDEPAELPARARALLEAQLTLAHEPASAGSYGHLASAATTAGNVLRACGRNAEAGHLAGIAAMERAEEMLLPLRQALETALAAPAAAAPAAAAAADPAVLPPASGTAAAGARTLRVDAARIDALVRLTGELTVARNALAHLSKQASLEGNALATPLKERHASFEHLIRELQRLTLSLRVLPLRVAFQRLPRLVREIAETLGKSVELKVSGDDTEADKAIVEMLFEPLLHVVRNALDHGVETPALRATRGKPGIATIQLRAARQGDQVLVEIADDGAGMDPRRIREVAVNRGVVTAEVAAAMSETEVIDLVFTPGFSTAAGVTAVSGRGVGMDAVRAAIERLGGRVSLQSVAGQGTTVRLLLPFSAMMTTVMSVEAGGQMFGVPLDNVVETIRVPRSSLSAVGTVPAVVVRDQTIPLFDLASMLGEAGRAPDGDEATIVVAAFAGQRCGLDVDAVGERLEAILKPLDGLLAGTPGIAGTTLLGDGRVLLVLDIAELLQ